ncbi:18464_t:CDS:2 [Racocetra fulgida]|uniref:18464_t:CDS:1 n=1 Tax=Racocetra fulgida TaxID=60492 RepID=A0A9N9FDF0_9GLOM|nr:18464_t:CDS:2 [Racocetra fulgida]
MQKHFAQYPIIYITLKDLCTGTWDKIIEKLRALVVEIYDKHRYLISSLYPEEQEIFQRILKRDPIYPESQLEFSLKALSKHLRRYYKKQCIVLVDEYDSLIKYAYNKEYYEVANDFFKGMFSSLLKSNDENITKAMLVDVLRIAKSGFLSGLNNLIVYPLHQESQFHLYADKFGFTSDKVKLLFSLYEDLQINDIRKWYDGYISGGGIHLYNPWSIICLLSRGILDAYWTDTESTRTLVKCLWKASSSFKESIEKLLKGESITNAKVQDDLRYLDLDQCQDLAIWTLLYYAGYLTMNSEKHLVIPNEEIYNLLHGNLDLFSKEFENIIVDMLSFYEVRELTSGKNAEYVYHVFCLGVYDIKIVSKPGVNEMAIIFEFKVVHDKKSLHDAAQEGLLQIEKKQYRVGLEENIKKLLEIGIGFEEKKACVLECLFHRTEEGAWNKDYEKLISD